MSEDLIALATTSAPRLGLDALFLGGSYGSGTQDEWSDVDLVGLCPAGARPDVMARWRAALEARGDLAHWAQPFGDRLSNAITDGFARVDLYLVDTLDGRARSQLRPLHDPSGLWDDLPKTPLAADPDPERARRMATEFLRILGLTPVALGREEWVLMVRGAGMLRDLIMDMMLERHVHRGGMLHPSKVLTDGEMSALAALPAPRADRESVLAAHAALARAGLPVARALCEEARADWPERLERAATASLARAGVTI